MSFQNKKNLKEETKKNNKNYNKLKEHQKFIKK